LSETQQTERTLEAPPALWGWRTWASMAVAVAVIGLMVTRVDFDVIWREIVATDRRWVLLGFLAHYATYYFRGGRWKLVLGHTPRRTSRARYGLFVFFYNFVDNLVPAKLGDVYAAHMARINLGVRRSEAMGSIVFLRMIDAWVVLGLAAGASWWLFSSALPPLVFWALIGGGIISFAASGLMLAVAILHRRMPGWIPAKAQRMMRDLRERMVPNRKRVIGITLGTIVIWGLEILWIYALARAFGLEPSLVTVVFLTMIPLLASAFPLTPSGTGAVELALYSSLVVVGTPVAVATSLTFLNRVIDYWLHIGLGLVVWGARRRINLRVWSEEPVREQTLDRPPDAAADPGRSSASA